MRWVCVLCVRCCSIEHHLVVFVSSASVFFDQRASSHCLRAVELCGSDVDKYVLMRYSWRWRVLFIWTLRLESQANTCIVRFLFDW